MTTVFYLVRHGQTQLNLEKRVQGRCDSPLTEQGIQMARSLYSALSKINFIAVVSSPSPRAIATCQYMSHQKPDALYDGLQEFDFGTREGLIIKEAFIEKPKHPEGYAYWHGESRKKAITRYLNCLKEIAEKYGEGNILVSSHGTIIREVLFYLDPSLNTKENHYSLVPK